MTRLFQLVLVVMMLALVALLSAITTMHFAIHGAEVTVPDFRGLPMAEAFHKAANLGMNLSVDNRFFSAEVPAERVLGQSPEPGTVVRREWHVRVTESLGPQKVAIPNLVGQQERVAVIEIRRLGLEPGNTAHLPDPTVATGTIIAQNPAADATGVEQPNISLLVSEEGPPLLGGFVMPDFTGQPFTASAYSVVHAGLKLAPVRDVPAAIPAVPPLAGVTAPQPPLQPPIPTGSIVSQNPAAGYRVDANTPIEFTVAR
jgi:beta-lactam-binding protein with PASTA domain